MFIVHLTFSVYVLSVIFFRVLVERENYYMPGTYHFLLIFYGAVSLRNQSLVIKCIFCIDCVLLC